MKLKRIWCDFNILRSLPAILAYNLSKNKSIIRRDIIRWIDVQRLTHLNYPVWKYLVWLLVYSKEYRNLFYYRIKNILVIRLLGIFFPKLESLHIGSTNIGAGLFISHGTSSVIVGGSIGENCWINQQVTIGYGNHPIPPVIGNNVRIGAGAIVIGNISIGDNSTIGAGAVIAKNVEAGSVMIGNPAFVLKKHSQSELDLKSGTDEMPTGI